MNCKSLLPSLPLQPQMVMVNISPKTLTSSSESRISLRQQNLHKTTIRGKEQENPKDIDIELHRPRPVHQVHRSHKSCNPMQDFESKDRDIFCSLKNLGRKRLVSHPVVDSEFHVSLNCCLTHNQEGAE